MAPEKAVNISSHSLKTTPPPPGFNTFNNQVAGHFELQNMPCFLVNDHGHVLKMVDTKRSTGIVETAFFERIFNEDDENDKDFKELRQFLPKYFGLQTININGEKLCYLKLENLVADFAKPSIMDIKIGQITSDPFADKSKACREAMKYEYQTQLGFRILGCKAYKIKTDQTEYQDKGMCKKLTPGEIPTYISYFLDLQTVPERCYLISRIIQKLKKLHQWFSGQERVKFFSSSILIAFDGKISDYDGPNETTTDVIVRMIDFPHTYIDSNHTTNLDMNYIYGLNNLIRIFEELLNNAHM